MFRQAFRCGPTCTNQSKINQRNIKMLPKGGPKSLKIVVWQVSESLWGGLGAIWPPGGARGPRGRRFFLNFRILLAGDDETAMDGINITVAGAYDWEFVDVSNRFRPSHQCAWCMANGPQSAGSSMLPCRFRFGFCPPCPKRGLIGPKIRQKKRRLYGASCFFNMIIGFLRV